jgi:hypothetical protein
MKQLITIAILVMCSVAAFAESTQTPQQFVDELRSASTTSTKDTGWDLGFISGVIFVDPKVCAANGVTTISTITGQIADAVQAASAEPSFPKHLTTLVEKSIITVALEDLYPCK